MGSFPRQQKCFSSRLCNSEKPTCQEQPYHGNEGYAELIHKEISPPEKVNFRDDTEYSLGYQKMPLKSRLMAIRAVGSSPLVLAIRSSRLYRRPPRSVLELTCPMSHKKQHEHWRVFKVTQTLPTLQKFVTPPPPRPKPTIVN